MRPSSVHAATRFCFPDDQMALREDGARERDALKEHDTGGRPVFRKRRGQATRRTLGRALVQTQHTHSRRPRRSHQYMGSFSLWRPGYLGMLCCLLLTGAIRYGLFRATHQHRWTLEVFRWMPRALIRGSVDKPGDHLFSSPTASCPPARLPLPPRKSTS